MHLHLLSIENVCLFHNTTVTMASGTHLFWVCPVQGQPGFDYLPTQVGLDDKLQSSQDSGEDSPFLAWFVPISHSIKTCGIVLRDKPHFRVAFYGHQSKAHLCNNHAVWFVSRYVTPVRWMDYLGRVWALTDTDLFFKTIFERNESSVCVVLDLFLNGVVFVVLYFTLYFSQCSPLLCCATIFLVQRHPTVSMHVQRFARLPCEPLLSPVWCQGFIYAHRVNTGNSPPLASTEEIFRTSSNVFFQS